MSPLTRSPRKIRRTVLARTYAASKPIGKPARKKDAIASVKPWVTESQIKDPTRRVATKSRPSAAVEHRTCCGPRQYYDEVQLGPGFEFFEDESFKKIELALQSKPDEQLISGLNSLAAPCSILTVAERPLGQLVITTRL
jgi:hypothetical protein